MPVLDCSVKTCHHNAENQCCLNNIKVEGHKADTSETTACGSFQKKSEDSFTNSYSQQNPNTILDINCKAQKCVFNQEEKCNAAHIGIAGNGASDVQQTECSSFYKE